jgi:hypothetical protein
VGCAGFSGVELEDERDERTEMWTLGFWVTPTWWRQGFATELGRRVLEIAFDHLSWDSMAASAATWNVASLHFEGTHLTWSDLSAAPAACAPAPFTHGGAFHPSGTFAINPVTWHELAVHGLTLRGSRSLAHEFGETRPPCALGLSGTWSSTGDLGPPSIAKGPAAPDGQHAMVSWGVLGVARLHYTLTTGCIVSKPARGSTGWRCSKVDGRGLSWRLFGCAPIRGVPWRCGTHPSDETRIANLESRMPSASATYRASVQGKSTRCQGEREPVSRVESR